MRRTSLLAAAVTAALVCSSPALAQVEAAQYGGAPGGPAAATAVRPGDPIPAPGGVDEIPDYVLIENGTVIIDGDVAQDCRSFASSVPAGALFPSSEADAPPDFPLADDSPDLEQARSVLEQCEQRGLLGLAAQYAANAPAHEQQPPAGRAELPSTGGPYLRMPSVALVGGVLLGVLGALGIIAPRRIP